MTDGTKKESGDQRSAGFDLLRLDQGASLYLPHRTVCQLREERQRRQAQEIERLQQEESEHRQQRQGEGSRKHEEADAKAAKLRVLTRARPQPGWHRVLHQLVDLAKELDSNAIERSADRDVNQHRRRIVERLVEFGPDRRVAMPQNWRAEMDGLEEALPHFTGPIRALRQALALAEATRTAPRIAPQLLLGPPGVGKTYFSHRVAELLGSTHAEIAFDQPSAGVGLRGSDAHWMNTQPGVLFKLICMGEVANPVVLLDEMDKAFSDSSRTGSPLGQLHGVLERETAQRLQDISVEITFDASLTVYVGTANSLQGIDAPLTSRMEVFAIQPPDTRAAIDIASSIARQVLRRLHLDRELVFEHRALVLLGHLSPRLMTRAAEKAVATAVVDERLRIGEDDMWRELGDGNAPKQH